MEVVVDRIREVEDLFSRDIVPLLRRQDGFRSAYFLKDPMTGNCLAMTFWESENAMLASERSHFFQEQVAKLLKFFKAVPVRETYAVAVDDRIK
jgi:heme-degrading monooxygenase HmoA